MKDIFSTVIPLSGVGETSKDEGKITQSIFNKAKFSKNAHEFN
jgi:hypothetical protein